MKGICFIEPMFHKVVSGEKTQTRRIISGKTLEKVDDYWSWREFAEAQQTSEISVEDRTSDFARYRRGETLYLKEPYCQDCDFIQHQGSREWRANGKILYKYNGDEISELARDSFRLGKWENKLFMPEKYARYFIEITDVRVERLQDISDADCVKEGITVNPEYDDDVRTGKLLFSGSHYIVAYADLIDELNGKGTWESNPYVFVYDFELFIK
jgi:hypothetical protein